MVVRLIQPREDGVNNHREFLQAQEILYREWFEVWFFISRFNNTNVTYQGISSSTKMRVGRPEKKIQM